MPNINLVPRQDEAYDILIEYSKPIWNLHVNLEREKTSAPIQKVF